MSKILPSVFICLLTSQVPRFLPGRQAVPGQKQRMVFAGGRTCACLEVVNVWKVARPKRLLNENAGQPGSDGAGWS
jgi:hypothetical protein